MTDNKLQDRIERFHLPDPMKQHLKLCIEVDKRHCWHRSMIKMLRFKEEKVIQCGDLAALSFTNT
jgi:hypothetical protein